MFQYLKNLFSIVSANFITNVVSIITLPIFIRKIGVDTYGKWIYFVSIIALISASLHFGTGNILIREISAKRIKAKKTIRHIIGIKLLLFLSLTIVLFSYNYIFNIDSNSFINKFFYIYVIPILLLDVFSNYNILNSNELFKQASFLKLISQLFYTIPIIFFINGPNDIYYAAIGSSIGGFISVSIGWVILFSRGFSMVPLFNIKESIMILKKSYLYFLSTISSLTYNRYGVIISKIFLNDHALGLYSAGIKFTEILIEFLSIVHKPLAPKIVLLIEQNNDYMKLIKLSFKICVLTFVPICLGLFIVSEKLILLIFGSKFYDSIFLINLLTPSLIFNSMSIFFSNLLIAFNKHDKYFFSVIMGAITSLIITTVLAIMFGLTGITIGFTISHFCVMIMSFYLIRRKIKTLLYDYSYFSVIQILILFIYSYVIINLNSLFFENIILSIGFSVLMYVPAMYFVLKDDFSNTVDLLKS